jgi:hypothetical protein
MTRKHVALSAAAAAACFALSLAVAAQVPGPAPKGADRWEYCELHFRIGGPLSGGGGAAKPTTMLITADEELAAADWAGLATKLKAPAAKKSAKEASHKVRVLNHLGRQGWELAPPGDREYAATGVLLFKRKLAK